MSNKQKYKLQVEGWRGISHSYALVNQFQLLQWNKNNNVLIKHMDVPFLMPHWSISTNASGFSSHDLEIINISQEIEPQGIYKIYAPFQLIAHEKLPTLTFGVTEFGFSKNAFTQEQLITYKSNGGKIHTPSQWSKSRMIANGIDESLIHVIPHSADSRYFHSLPQAQIEEQRTIFGYSDDDIVLLNVGGHLWNKGLDLLIKAFSNARKKNKRLKLLLKDQRTTYLMNSDDFVKKTLAEVNDLEALNDGSIKILMGHFDLSQLNAAYNLADYYLTPYRAEGFNLPALEAAAAGTSVIATAGGATDDFLIDACHYKVEGRLIENAPLKDDLPINAYIEPDLDHLITLLCNLDRKIGPFLPGCFASWSEISSSIVNTLKGRG